MDQTIIKVGDKEIDIREGCIYVTLGHRTFYLENSVAAPLCCSTWIEGEPESHYEAIFKKAEND